MQWIVGKRPLGQSGQYEYKIFTAEQLSRALDAWRIASESYGSRAEAVVRQRQLESAQWSSSASGTESEALNTRGSWKQASTVLMSWDDSNIAGDIWTWRIVLAEEGPSSWSITAVQESSSLANEAADDDKEDEWVIEGGGGNRTGRQLVDAIRRLFGQTPLDTVQEPDWDQIVVNAGRLSRSLAAQMQVALDEDQRRETSGE